ncbi:MAG: bifunctional folylpolyglutamate synthase/dihydrofolate synthase [Lachnospiraceae bacterium]|nr:bifunctional folylpolyglutamate synthase/dihydrofolate synthase [Lachnospiraceae bacterium]
MKSYEDVEKYILDIPKFAGKHTLKDTKELLDQISGGRIKSRIIHVAGTNGKGSVCAYLRSILMESRYSVGMFISPHLETMRERISINDVMISKEEFVSCFGRVIETVDSKNHPSFFEFLFLMAMAYFKVKEPEYIILETGMGGRLDATNCIEKPEVCVITEIGYDHMQYLGNSLSKIAAEKAGIIKKGVPVVFMDKRAESTKVLTEYAKKAQSPTIIIGKNNILNVNINNKSIDFSLHTGYYNYVSLLLDTVALYQTENAALAVAASEVLQDAGITEDSVRKGLWSAQWPGRMEEAMPGIYLDGAHNEDGIEAFLHTVERDGCRGKRFLLFGVVRDKRYDFMIQKIIKSGLFDQAAVTLLETDRSVSIEELKTIWGQCTEMICSFHIGAEEAYHHLLSLKGNEDVIYIAGSMYLIGQMKSLMRRK